MLAQAWPKTAKPAIYIYSAEKAIMEPLLLLLARWGMSWGPDASIRRPHAMRMCARSRALDVYFQAAESRDVYFYSQSGSPKCPTILVPALAAGYGAGSLICKSVSVYEGCVQELLGLRATGTAHRIDTRGVGKSGKVTI